MIIFTSVYLCLLRSQFISYKLYLSQLSGLSVNNSLRCQRMISPTSFVTHRIIPSLDTAFHYSTTPTSLDPATNSEYLNSSLTCISVVQISTRISTLLSLKSIPISICQTHTPLSLTPTLFLLQLYAYSDLRRYDYSNIITTPTLLQRYDYSNVMTTPTL